MRFTRKIQRNSHAKKAVLVTGCSSGIGRAIAIYLAANNFTVFATVRKSKDVENLRELRRPNLIPTYPLDLTNLDHIQEAREFVKEELKQRELEGLYGLVNNAGGGSIAPIELLDLDRFHTELQARVLAPVALLQSFLPLIREAKGRVLWIATPALLPSPYLTDIHACDFAVNFIARTLQIELMPWDIPSILIRCGGIKTASPERTYRTLAENMQKWPRERCELYAGALEKVRRELKQFDKKRTEPSEVAKVVYRALTSPKPKRRYQVGYMSRFAALLELLPQTTIDSIVERKYR